jgi:hypothetical protein
MITECFNPACRRQLDYLRTGRVVRVVHQNGMKVEIEHFWLCGDCCQSYDLRFLENGSVTLNAASEGTSFAQTREHRWVQSA